MTPISKGGQGDNTAKNGRTQISECGNHGIARGWRNFSSRPAATSELMCYTC